MLESFDLLFLRYISAPIIHSEPNSKRAIGINKLWSMPVCGAGGGGSGGGGVGGGGRGGVLE